MFLYAALCVVGSILLFSSLSRCLYPYQILFLLCAIYLVIAPIVEKPKIEFLYAALFVVGGLIFYFPLVHFKLISMGKYLFFICHNHTLRFINTFLSLKLKIFPYPSVLTYTCTRRQKLSPTYIFAVTIFKVPCRNFILHEKSLTVVKFCINI